jgi:two-component system, LytTR family, sensor kinase
MPLRKIEFWLATLVMLSWSALLLIFFLEGHYSGEMEVYTHPNPLQLFARTAGSRILLVFIGYLAFLFLNFWVFDRLYARKKWDWVVAYTLLTFIVVATAFYVVITGTAIFPREAFVPMATIPLLLMLAYNALKKIGAYSFSSLKTSKTPLLQLSGEVLTGFFLWLFILFLITSFSNSWMTIHSWAFLVPGSYLVFRLNTHWLLPRYEQTGRDGLNYILQALLLTFLISCCLGIFYSRGNVGGFILFWAVQLLVITPLAYLVFQRSRHRQQQLHGLKTALGQTTADLQQLRSQINPHFLFNALNTLYGTALQEGSERTAEGIQKLGDMMRFMLYENLQDSISLEKEKEYLRNYIDLQLLRIQSSEHIDIQISIPEQQHPYQLAPMLLIPFVENAFKHGISLKQKSWIKVVLSCDDQHLYFDVYNSLHQKWGADPEEHQGGIGLENVRQRLALLYPRQHELIIRKTAEEFIVHLTLTLSPARARPLQPVADQQDELSPSIALTKG